MRILAPVLALAAIVLIAVPTSAAPGGKLRTFGTGDVSVSGPRTATLDNDAAEYSGVYLSSRKAMSIRKVSFSFDYAGSVAGGAPRFSIPIDTNHDKTVEAYAFLDALNCGDTGTVSTEDPDCRVFFGSESFANWDAFVAAYPSYRIPPGSPPFIIADQAGHYEISNIDLH